MENKLGLVRREGQLPTANGFPLQNVIMQHVKIIILLQCLNLSDSTQQRTILTEGWKRFSALVSHLEL